MNQSLYSLFARKLISLEDAMGLSSDQDELRNMLEGKGGMTIVDPSLRPRA